MNLSKTLRKIRAVTFHEIKFTGHLFLMDEDYNEETKYTQAEVVEINTAWWKLYDEYYLKVSNDGTKIKKELSRKSKSLKILVNINILKAILETMELIQNNEDYIDKEVKLKTLGSLKITLKKITKRVDIDLLKNLEYNINKIDSFKRGLESTYKINHKKVTEVEEKDILLFYETKSMIESILKKDNIPEDINMLQWIAYEKQALSLSKKNQENV